MHHEFISFRIIKHKFNSLRYLSCIYVFGSETWYEIHFISPVFLSFYIQNVFKHSKCLTIQFLQVIAIFLRSGGAEKRKYWIPQNKYFENCETKVFEMVAGKLETDQVNLEIFTSNYLTHICYFYLATMHIITPYFVIEKKTMIPSTSICCLIVLLELPPEPRISLQKKNSTYRSD